MPSHESRQPSPAARPRPLLLASASPRRRALLAVLGRPYTATRADIDERARPGEAPETYVRRMAHEKALRVADRLRDGEPPPHSAPRAPAASPPPLVIGADTIVVLEGRILGKPADDAEAARVLRALRGRRHLVHTGIAVVDPSSGALRSEVATTGVWMRDYTEEEIEAYVAGGDPMDKAGAYAIQHPTFRPVARLEGSEANVIGLPLAALAQLLRYFPADGSAKT